MPIITSSWCPSGHQPLQNAFQVTSYLMQNFYNFLVSVDITSQRHPRCLQLSSETAGSSGKQLNFSRSLTARVHSMENSCPSFSPMRSLMINTYGKKWQWQTRWLRAMENVFGWPPGSQDQAFSPISPKNTWNFFDAWPLGGIVKV